MESMSFQTRADKGEYQREKVQKHPRSTSLNLFPKFKGN